MTDKSYKINKCVCISPTEASKMLGFETVELDDVVVVGGGGAVVGDFRTAKQYKLLKD